MSTSLSGLSGNFFPSAQNGFTTTLASTISSGAATVPLNSVAGYTNGQIATFVVDPSDAIKKQTFTGVVDTSGVQLTSVVWTAGTNQSHTAGSTVVDYVTATHISQVTKGITQQHTQAGLHGAITATSLAATGNISSSAGTISTTLVDSLKDFSVALSTYRANTAFDFVVSGGVWTADSAGSTLAGSMTALVCMINGRRISISAVTAHAFTASKDTYVDILDNADGTGTVVYTEATNNAASVALAANSIRIAIVVTGAGNIAAAASINQGQTDRVLPIASSVAYAVTDSLGNLIYPKDPNRKTLGYRQITSNATQTSGTQSQVTGLSMPIVIPTGRKCKLTFWSDYLANNTSTDFVVVGIWDGTVASGTQIAATELQATGAGQQLPGIVNGIVQPSLTTASSKTYNIGLSIGGGGTGTIKAGSTTPAFIMAELV